MGRKFAMTFEAPKKRWRKMVKGETYTVTCETLGCDPTKEASWRAANEWWAMKAKEIAKLPEEYEEAIANLEAIGQNPTLARIVQGDIKALRKEGLSGNPPKLSPSQIDPIGQARIRLGIESPIKERNKLLSKQIEAYAKLYRAREANGDVSFGRRKSVEQGLDRLLAWAGNVDVKRINSEFVVDYNTYLRGQPFTASTKSTYWEVFKGFVRHLWEMDHINLPKALTKRMLAFGHTPPKIQTYDNDELKMILDDSVDELRLFILLALNCGFYAVDISSLTKDQIDWKKGTLTHKRVKTKKKTHTPEVTYKLWPEVLELFPKVMQSEGERCFSTQTGEPFHKGAKDVIGTKMHKKTRSKGIEKSFGDLRNTSATRLESNPDHAPYKEYFLGHAPSLMSERHYAVKSNERLAAATDWLRSQYKL